MTSNQIAFAVHKENQRHNRFTEKEGKRHNLQSERIGMSNVELGYSNLNEMFRHNYASEGINQQLADIKEKENVVNQEQVEVNEYNAETNRRKLVYDAFGTLGKGILKPVVAAGYAVADWMQDIKSDPADFMNASKSRQAGVVK